MKKPNFIKTKIKLLKRARVNIQNGNAEGVCFAISRGSGAFTQTENKACIELKDYITGVLDGCVWLQGWQEANGFDYRAASQRKEDRIAWIDWMIADYQKWGE